ncbi:MAG: TonB-dependent hemoglobin/transferrin/lactoferrin family receptor [Hyphomonas sp.]|nr:TonB-dependent hemoglobin/transferrin/lactoferrin family receptor [Hyphomonas sp.]
MPNAWTAYTAPRRYRWSLLVSASVVFAWSPAFAQTEPGPSGPQVVRDKVTVTATRIEEATDEVPATVTVLTDQDIENELVTDIKDLVRFEPGISVQTQPARFGAALGATGRAGNSGFNIRGLEGNRVLIQVDGVRVPYGYSFGPQANGRGNYVDLDLLQAVEFVRGPSSALYGSDGLAGSVSFITRDPDSLVQEGEQYGVRARTAYASADRSWANSLIGATEYGDWSALLAYTRRDAKATDNQGEVGGEGATRTQPNPQDTESNSWLAKMVYAPGDMNRFRLTFDGTDSETTADILSGRATSFFTGQTTLSLTSRDLTERQRIAFDHEIDFGEGFLTEGRWSIYAQSSDTRQFSDEQRVPGPSRTRDNTFDTAVWGVSGQLIAEATTGSVEHNLLLGVDHSVTETDNLRDGAVPPFGETFPNRASPVTDYTLTGIFLQDEISLMGGSLRFYPGLRFDAYELDPKRDAFYPANFPAETSDGDQVSPKLGVVAWPTDQFGLFANYAEGFKAPEPGQVNEGFENLLFGYTTLANPNLDPESSASIEGGLRMRDVMFGGGVWSGSLAVYKGDYQDFISNQVVGGTGSPGDPLQFQYINLTEVEVSGVELEARGYWNNGFGVRFAASRTEGDVIGTPDTPLESVDPAQIVAGVSYDDLSGRFGGQLISTWTDAKEAGDVADASLFRSNSIIIFDATAYYSLTDQITIRAGAFNLSDEKYWYWSDVRGVSATSASLDAYTQPGRNFSISLSFRD